MRRWLALALLALAASPLRAADNATLITPCGTGCVTVRAKDVGLGVQSPVYILGDTSGNPIYGSAGTANANVLTVQGIASMTKLLVDGSGVTQPVSGTITANQGGAWTVAATQSGTWNVGQSGTWTVQQGTPPWSMVGNVASGASDSGNPVKVGGVFNTTQPTVTNGQRVDGQYTARGSTIVATGADPFSVSGTVAATQSGTWTVQQGTPPWTVTNQQSNNQLDYDTGAGTQNMTVWGIALPASGGSVAGGTATNPVRVDPTGTTTQPVSGTVTANAGSGTFTVSGTVTANAGTNLNTSALALDTSVNGLLLSQGSTTSGQKGPLGQGAVTTNAPSYTTAQTDPLSLDTSGNLRISLKDTPANTNNLNINIAASAATVASNVTQFGGTNISTGTGTGGTGIPRVTVSNDSAVKIWDGTNTVAAKASGTNAATTDVALVFAPSPNPSDVCTSFKAISQTASTDLVTSTNKLHICAMLIVSATAQSVSLVEGTGTTCATGTAAIMGATTAANGMALAANGGFTHTAERPFIVTATTADHLCLLQSGAGNVSGFISYVDHN